MKTNNMLIALYFVLSVALLLFTRSMAAKEENVMLGEQLKVANTPASTEPEAAQQQKAHILRTADPADEPSTITKISKSVKTSQDKVSAQKLE